MLAWRTRKNLEVPSQTSGGGQQRVGGKCQRVGVCTTAEENTDTSAGLMTWHPSTLLSFKYWVDIYLKDRLEAGGGGY